VLPLGEDLDATTLGSPSVQPSTAAILGKSARLSERSEFRARPESAFR